MYEQDICGPCAVPFVCKNFLLLKIELLHVKQCSKLSKIHSTRGLLVGLFKKTDFTASKPDFLSMLDNMLTIPKLTKIALAGKNTINISNYINLPTSCYPNNSQSQFFFTTTHDMNRLTDLYSSKLKGYRK